MSFAYLIAFFIDGTIPELIWLSQPWLLFLGFILYFTYGGGLAEEFGWRGYAQRHLQARFNAFYSSIILGGEIHLEDTPKETRCNACSPVSKEMKIKLNNVLNSFKEAKFGKINKILKSLAEINRLKILVLLKELGELCVCELDEAFGIKQSTMSHHLSILRENNLIQARKDGRWSYYKLKEEGERVINFIISNL